MLNNGKMYKLSPEQTLIADFAADTLDYYNDLVWLMHSLNSDRIEHNDNALFRSRISKKYDKMVADYNDLVDLNLIDREDEDTAKENVLSISRANKIALNHYRKMATGVYNKYINEEEE